MVSMPTSSWTQRLETPSKLFGGSHGLFDSSDGFELYEEDGEFVLTIDLPGFDTDDIELGWNDGRLNVAAEHVDEDRARKRTYHRTFRMPKEIESADIEATYENGVLEVRLPIEKETGVSGTPIEIEG